MRNKIEVRTQVEFDAAIKADVLAVCLEGNLKIITRNNESPWIEVHAGCNLRVVAWGSSQPHVEARGSSQPHVEARGSSQPHVEAWESSQPHVVAWESSQPHVVAWESSQPHVVAWGSSQPHVVAWGSSQPHVVAWESSQPHVVARGSSQPHVVARGSSQPHVEARGSSQPHVVARGSSQPHVEAWGYVQISLSGKVIANLSKFVSALIHGALPQVEGGQQTHVDISTPLLWCDYYGLSAENGAVVLYKAVNNNYHSPKKMDYTPGTIPVAPDWDGGEEECGGGLHFSPTPFEARLFNPDAERFVACPVSLDDMSVHPNGIYPEKVKARGCCGPTWEVDIDGNKIEKTENHEVKQQ